MDGTEVKPQDRFSYKAHMLDDVPNLFWCIGYTNASWTLRADMTARATAKLIEYMDAHGYTHAYPHLGGEQVGEKSAWDLQAGYVLRNPHALPRSGTKRPWVVRQDYWADAVDFHFMDKIDENMTFIGWPRRQRSGLISPTRFPGALLRARLRTTPCQRAACSDGVSRVCRARCWLGL